MKIMELVEKNITARTVLTEGAIRNAIRACLAMSGSTNAVMHLTALAREAEVDIDVLSEFDTLSDSTPQIAKMNPASRYNIIDFYKDGGVPGVVRRFNADVLPLLPLDRLDESRLPRSARTLLRLCRSGAYPRVYPLIYPAQVLRRKLGEAAFALRKKKEMPK